MNCDVIQNPSLPTKGKGRKRGKIDHNPDSCKRERVIKMENNDISHQKRGHFVKPDEIANLVDKDGGLVNLPSVDRLLNLMQQDCDPRIKKACEVTSWRIMLAGVIASTEKEECLNRFVQLGGLPMLNDWLQEAHKGKDGGSPKKGDKGLEELLLTLLQALDKLPVDLDALKKCNVGKSVNNLRSHKNSEIQKKARKLVDTWKKRVDAEMKLSGDSKTVHGSASKQSSVNPSENSAETSEISKSLSATKGVANISAVDDSLTNYVSDIVCSGKSQVLTTGVKDHLLKGHVFGPTEVSLGTMKEDKSSNSNQSQNNSQSWSGGPSNGALSNSKEDAKLSFAVSAGAKAPNTMSHDSVTSIKGDSSGSLAAQKESVSRLLVWGRVTPQEKVAHYVTVEKELEQCSTEDPNSLDTKHKQKGENIANTMGNNIKVKEVDAEMDRIEMEMLCLVQKITKFRQETDDKAMESKEGVQLKLRKEQLEKEIKMWQQKLKQDIENEKQKLALSNGKSEKESCHHLEPSRSAKNVTPDQCNEAEDTTNELEKLGDLLDINLMNTTKELMNAIVEELRGGTNDLNEEHKDTDVNAKPNGKKSKKARKRLLKLQEHTSEVTIVNYPLFTGDSLLEMPFCQEDYLDSQITQQHEELHEAENRIYDLIIEYMPDSQSTSNGDKIFS